MSGKRLERTEQVPRARHTESKPAFVLTFKIVPGIEQGVSQALHYAFGLRRSHFGGESSQAIESRDCAPQTIPMLIASTIERIAG